MLNNVKTLPVYGINIPLSLIGYHLLVNSTTYIGFLINN